MTRLIVFEQFGCEYKDAHKIYVLRKKDINDALIDEFLSIMDEINVSDPTLFYEKSKICILANMEIYNFFLNKLEERVKKDK